MKCMAIDTKKEVVMGITIENINTIQCVDIQRKELI